MENASINKDGSGLLTDKDFIIVIGRQFGSGGRTIGKIIAQKLGIGYYDTELLSRAAESLGVRPEIFKEHDEKRPSALRTFLQGAYGIADNFHVVPLTGERIYSVQSKIIKEVCRKGSCVIVGRNADFVMRKHPRLLSVFFHSPIEHRARRIMERKEAVTEDEAIDMAQQHDKRRESFYNYYRGEKLWGQAHNYHLTLDTSTMDNDAVADLIISVAKKKFE